MRKIGIVVVLVVLMALVFAAAPPPPIPDPEPTPTATTGIGVVKDAVGSLCTGLKEMLPVVAMLMVILAGVIYASGQMMGAETRARTNVWATAALTGALMAILIAVVAPSVLATIYPAGAATFNTGCT